MLYALLCWIWGSTWLVIKIGLNGVPPVTGAALRMAISGALLLCLMSLIRMPFPRTPALPTQIIIQGIGQFGLNYGLVYWAEQAVPSGLTAVLFAIAPIVTAVVASWIFHMELLNAVNVVGLVVGFCGVVIIYWSEVVKAAHAPALGVAAVLLASTIASTATVIAKRWGQSIPPLAMIAPGQLFAGVLLGLLAFAMERSLRVHFDGTAVACIAYLAVFGSGVAFLGFFHLLRTADATRLSLITYITPVIAVILGSVALHEQLARATLVGAAIIFAGIGLVHYKPAKTPRTVVAEGDSLTSVP